MYTHIQHACWYMYIYSYGIYVDVLQSLDLAKACIVYIQQMVIVVDSLIDASIHVMNHTIINTITNTKFHWFHKIIA